MAAFLFKTEPSDYAFADLVRDKRVTWEGVSNALALIHHEVGSNAIIVDEAEVVTGTDVKTVAESGDGSIFTRIGAWFTGTKQVASTETKTLKSTEWRINYAVPTQPRPSNP